MRSGFTQSIAFERGRALASGPVVLLINPPLWSAHAPYLAIPLLAGVLREKGKPVRCLDLNIEFLDLVVSARGLSEIGKLLERRTAKDIIERQAIEQAKVVCESAIARVDSARAILRSFDSLTNHHEFNQAKITMRDALRVISASFDGLRFDLTTEYFDYLAPSSAAIRRAATNPLSLYRWAFEKIIPDAIADPDIGLVGISISAETQLTPAVTAATLIKALRPNLKIVVGGNYTTRMMSAWSGELHPFHDIFDYCILYEGEEALPALYERLFERRLGPIPGLSEVIAGNTVHTPPVKTALKHAAKPAFDLISLEKYFSPGPVLPVFSSRGCAWKCAFCSIPYASGSFRRRTASEVAAEIAELARLHGSRYFMFVDEIMTIRSLADVSRELIAIGSPIKWYAETRFSQQWTQDIADELYRAGCRRLNFGLESYNQRILDLMEKEVQVEYIEDNLEICLKAGIAVHLFAILGFPGETLEEAARTVAFCERVVERSRTVYGNAYSSWGASRFTVDVHSPVGKDPERFGVRLVEPPENHDLSLSREIDYVHSGGSIFEQVGADMNPRARNMSFISQVSRFHRSLSTASEEEAFLRTCLGTELPGVARRSLSVWERLPERDIALSPEVTICHTQRSVLNASVHAHTVIYDPRTGYLIELPIPDLNLDPLRIKQSHESVVQCLAPQIGGQADETVAALCRFGMFDLSEPLAAVDFDSPNFSVIVAEAHVHTQPSGPGNRVLVSGITGVASELDGPGLLLWEAIASPDGLTAGHLKSLMDIAVDKARFTGDVRTLLECGLAFAREDRTRVAADAERLIAAAG
ncbi:B12-binding domain-containing radical SAM protein [Burkholderia stagnalis]|uniref:B12-binding domain-containing radical SAM protein n=1 Tax=Burkholderia stagnalis TaxID=1503054 RepID=UPI000F5FFA4D|nr:radical SAM protein [Burkholderia stagnalis]RQY82206.1 radical SAM protein [Burkholderia stagnalis]